MKKNWTDVKQSLRGDKGCCRDISSTNYMESFRIDKIVIEKFENSAFNNKCKIEKPPAIHKLFKYQK